MKKIRESTNTQQKHAFFIFMMSITKKRKSKMDVETEYIHHRFFCRDNTFYRLWTITDMQKIYYKIS
jgi:hypothetical protein